MHQGTAARSDLIGEVAVDEARLAVADVDALGAWRHLEPLDGLADFVFWGADAGEVAEQVAAPALGNGKFGWLDRPLGDAVELGMPIEHAADGGDVRLAPDFRPHSDHHRALQQMRATPTESATIEVGGARVCAFFTGWGDGFFPVVRDLDDAGRLLRVRIRLGTERQRELLGEPAAQLP